MKIETTQKILDYNSQYNKISGLELNNILLDLNKLIKFGTVNVGYRATTGNSKNLSIKYFQIWRKVIKEIKKQKIEIEEINIPQNNRYTTSNGGAWNEFQFNIIKLEFQ